MQHSVIQLNFTDWRLAYYTVSRYLIKHACTYVL